MKILSSLWIPFAALLLGLLIGLQFDFTVPQAWTRYTAVAVLAALDSVLGAVRAELNQSYDNRVFISGFIFNTLLAIAITYLGDRLGADIWLAAVVAFGSRLFSNLAIIRRHFI